MLVGPEERRSPAAGLVYAQKAVKLFPQDHFILNTLGVALYRNGRHSEAVTALGNSLAAGKGEFIAFDLYFLAMAHAKLGRAAEAQDCFDRAEAWVAGQKNLTAQHVAEVRAFAAAARAALDAAPD
jgi:uncharacterized protein HemY